MLSFVVSDLLAILLAGTSAVWLRNSLGGDAHAPDYMAVLPILAIFPVTFWFFGLYPGVAAQPILEFERFLRATGLGFLLVISSTFLSKQSASYSRLVFLMAWPLSILSLLMFRSTIRRSFAGSGWWGIPTVIFGEGNTAREMLRTLRENRHLGLRPVAQFGPQEDTAFLLPDFDGLVVGHYSAAPHFAQSCAGCYAILAMPDFTSQQLLQTVSTFAIGYSHVFLVPDLKGFSSLRTATKEIGGVLGIEVSQSLYDAFPTLLKRCLDISMGAAVALLAVPCICCIYAVILLTSGAPVFYGQKRIGHRGKPFIAWKFRTMVTDADATLRRHLQRSEALRSEWESNHKLRRDPRITPFGRFLRKTSLDELPQLWNILRGQMSFVGPRPIVEAEVQKYGDKFDCYLKVKPGLTGMWQISGRNNTSYSRRIQLDEYYVQNWSVWLDLYILFRSLKTILLAEGAY